MEMSIDIRGIHVEIWYIHGDMQDIHETFLETSMSQN
jgi:hypothetical protein